MRFFPLIAGLLLALFSLAAEARMHAPYRGHRIVPAGAAPLDTFATPAAAYSMRHLKSTYTGPAIRLRRASDNAEADIGFLGFTGFTGAPIDTAAANAHCAATTCTVVTWYDQSGNARNATVGGGALPFVFNCLGSNPCLRSPDSGSFMEMTAAPVWVGKTSLSAVANRVSGSAQCQLTAKNINFLMTDAAPNAWYVTDFTSGALAFPATDNAWHAGLAVIADGSTPVVGRIDATETTGASLVGAAGTGRIVILRGVDTGGPCQSVEHVVWDGYALTANERAALTANQKSFWGF